MQRPSTELETVTHTETGLDPADQPLPAAAAAPATINTMFHIISHLISQFTNAANRLIGEVVQSRRRPLLGPSPG